MLVRNTKGEIVELKQMDFNSDREFYRALRNCYSENYSDDCWQKESDSPYSMKNIAKLLKRPNNHH